MITIERVDTQSRKQVHRFLRIPFRLYASHPQWVPPPLMDVQTMLNRQKHPFYEHSDADFFIAVRDGQDVGRIAALENRRFNEYHDTRQAQFYLFECEDDQEAATALFERVFEWARARGLDRLIGPKGFGALDGYGLLVEGFEHRQMMTMMNYNYEYYPRLVEALGFEKEVDFISCYINADTFRLPDRIHSIAERVQRRGILTVRRFRSKRVLLKWASRIGEAYNRAFVENWEYYPLTEAEVKFLVSNLVMVANPRLIKIITHGDDVVGFLFGFPDVSAALQRARGRLLPFGIIDLLLEMRRTKWVALNGAGILPEFQGRGGNALLYSEMEKTILEFGFQHADLTQVAETAVQMRRDLINLGGKPYKNHRVYVRNLSSPIQR
jgi:GNAT superfamily N-acetyltransferase